MKKLLLLLLSVILTFVVTSCNKNLKSESASSSETSSINSGTAFVSSDSIETSGNSSESSNTVKQQNTQGKSAVTENSVSSAAVPSSSSSSSEASSSEPQKLTVMLTITGLDGDVVYSADNTEITDGITVFKLTKAACEENSIEFKSQSSSYISSMGGYTERKPTSMAGWLYKINGTVASIGCGQYKLHGGEKIEWIFSTTGKP